MSENLHDIDQIQRYLDRSLSEAEKSNLENRLKEEPGLKSLYLEHRQLIRGIRYANLRNKLQQLKALEAALPNTENPKANGRQIWLKPTSVRYAIAASVVLFAAIIFAVVNYSGLNRPPDLYAKYFEPFDSPGSGVTRSSENEMPVKSKAYEAYDAGNYAVASELFEQILAEKEDAIVHLCLANAYMSMEQFDRAEETLLQMLKVHADLLTQTKWYLALTYVKQNKLEKARATLWEISDSSTYGEKAKKVLNELD